jgi:hypothetical protein
MPPTVFNVQIDGSSFPVTVNATRVYPTGGGVYLQLNTTDERYGPVFIRWGQGPWGKAVKECIGLCVLVGERGRGSFQHRQAKRNNFC